MTDDDKLVEALEYASLKLDGEPRFGDVKRKVDEALKQHAPDALLRDACALYDDALDKLVDAHDALSELAAMVRGECPRPCPHHAPLKDTE